MRGAAHRGIGVLVLIVLVIAAVSAFLGGLIHRDPGGSGPPPGWQVIRPPHEVSALVEHDDRIWAGGEDGVTVLERASGEVVAELDLPKPIRHVSALVFDRSGTLWIGHEAGLTRWDGTAFTTYSKKTGLPDDRVTSLLEDREGRLWVGTWKGAACCLLSSGPSEETMRVLTVWRAADGLAADMVSVMLEDRSGGLWFGSSVAPRGGLSLAERSTGGEIRWQSFTVDNGLPHNNVTCLLERSDGSVWAGTGFAERGGAVSIVRGQDGVWRPDERWGKAQGLAGDKVRSILEDTAGSMWFGSEYDGVARVSGDHVEVFTLGRGLTHNEVKTMLQDSAGDLWLGTLDGITRISAEALHPGDGSPDSRD